MGFNHSNAMTDLFRALSAKEEKMFREYAETHNPELTADGKVSSQQWEVTHPVIREVWLKNGIVPGYPLPKTFSITPLTTKIT